MVRSAEFVAWEKLAMRSFSHAAGVLPELCFWSTRIFVPVIKHRPDIDNAPKAIHDALRRSGVAPDDYYLVKTSLEYWSGEYLIIHLKEEPLEKWQAILKPSPGIVRKIRAAKIAQNSPRLA